MHLLHHNHIAFPHPTQADSDGILAIGGDLSVERLLLAYQFGIFPWYSKGDPIIWWSPDPRFAMKPGEIYISKSMRNVMNQNRFRITLDQNFEEVIRNCKGIYRPDQGGTWITDEMKEAYLKLNKLGYAHSVEVWQDDNLVGGLYGVSLGKVFFGESMFSKVSNASKFGFISFCKILQREAFVLIDCQVHNAHMRRLGAHLMDRSSFLEILKVNRLQTTNPGRWSSWI